MDLSRILSLMGSFMITGVVAGRGRCGFQWQGEGGGMDACWGGGLVMPLGGSGVMVGL